MFDVEVEFVGFEGFEGDVVVLVEVYYDLVEIVFVVVYW